jgi:hypothetical protein
VHFRHRDKRQKLQHAPDTNNANITFSAPFLFLPLNPRPNIPHFYHFNFFTHDFSNPTAWHALADSLRYTFGCVPRPEALVNIVNIAAQTLLAPTSYRQQNIGTSKGIAGAENPSQFDGNGTLLLEHYESNAPYKPEIEGDEIPAAPTSSSSLQLYKVAASGARDKWGM